MSKSEAAFCSIPHFAVTRVPPRLERSAATACAGEVRAFTDDGAHRHGFTPIGFPTRRIADQPIART